MITVDYTLPMYGLGTDFSQFDRPITFAESYTNRFRNITGGAERRAGAARVGTAPGQPSFTRVHERVDNKGNVKLYASDDFSNIWKFNTIASGNGFYNPPFFVQNARLISAQVGDKLIFVNGQNRNFYTDDDLVTHELKALITQGICAGGTNNTTLVDGQISDWIDNTLVANNDIVHNITRNGYAIVSTISSAQLTTTYMGATGTGAGQSDNPVPGDTYEIIDYVNLNIIPAPDNVPVNTATANGSTTTSVVGVTGVDFSTTEIRFGDIIYNTTQGAISFVGSVSANVNLQQSITGQTTGDALAFFKSAMPIASWIHVHYGRAYYLDSRNQRRIVISAPDDPQDVTTYQKTLDTTSFSFGSQQPTGDVILSMGTFQKYFVASGQKNLYIYEGINPIADTAQSSIDFSPIATYPNGIASRFGLGTNGSDLLHITTEGLQAINIGNISNTTVQNNASVPVRTAMLNAIMGSPTNDIQLSFYPRRSWLITKTGDICYILNTNPTYDSAGQLQIISSWSLYTGLWAQMSHYFVRHNGDLIACKPDGYLYELDNLGATDNGTRIPTDLTTAWLRLEEPQRTVRVKQGQYIKPVFESASGVAYTIDAVAGWDAYSSDSITVLAVGAGQIGSAVIGTTPIGAGNFAQADKQPLRWRGEEVRIKFTSESSATPDIITGYTMYGTIAGIR